MRTKLAVSFALGAAALGAIAAPRTGRAADLGAVAPAKVAPGAVTPVVDPRPPPPGGDPRGAARAHYARGLELASQNGYEGALREFNAAYALSPEFAVLYNIGQAHIALEHPGEAMEALGRYLRDGGERITPVRRAQVQAQIAFLHASLPNPDLSPEADAARAEAAAAGAAAGGALASAVQLAPAAARAATLAIRCPEPGLKLTLDGKSVDAATGARGIPVRPGAHRLALAAPGRRPGEHSLDVQPGAATIVICENPAAAPAIDRPRFSLDGPPVFSAAPAPAEAAASKLPKQVIGYALGGLGVALGGAAIGFYAWNRGQDHDAAAQAAYLAAHVGASDYYDRAVKYNEEVDTIHRTNLLTVGLAITSVGLLAGGLYLWHSGRTPAADSAAGVAPAPTLVSVAVGPGEVALGGAW